MTTANNNITMEVAPVAIIPNMLPFLDSTVNINQGDLCYLDTTAHLVKPLASTAANMTTLLGVSPVTIVSGKLKSSYQGTAVDAAESAVAVSGPISGVQAQFTLVTGDSINPGDLVYQDAAGTGDAQTVTVTNPSGGKAVGVYVGKAIATAAAGTLVQIVVGHRFPADTLVI